MKRLLALFIAATLLGCADQKSAPPAAGSPKDIAQANEVPLYQPPIKRGDPVPDPKLLVELFVYDLRVPLRTVSHNEEFWKHVDEQDIDVAQHDLLLANGFRVGTAPREDWDYFKKILEKQHLLSQLTSGSHLQASQMEIPLKTNLPEAFIAYFHPTKGLVAQVYDQCDASMVVAYEAVPRHPGDVSITATPEFTSQRDEITYTALNEPITQLFKRPEFLFDLKLQVNVAEDHFLIIGPSPDADMKCTLGHKLLYQASGGQETETVLIVSPQAFQFEQPTTKPATQPKSLAEE
jgi:hypothetical protein